jgi:hypothetical protein
VKPLFTLGRVVATPGALAAIGVSGDDLSTYLARHQSGDWGDIDAHDRKAGIPGNVRVPAQYFKVVKAAATRASTSRANRDCFDSPRAEANCGRLICLQAGLLALSEACMSLR